MGVPEQEALLRTELGGSDTPQTASPVHTSAAQEQAKLLYVDFWPACLHADEDFANVVFERFDTLLPRINAWLREHPKVESVKCETLSRKVSSPEQVGNTDPKFDVPKASDSVWHIKGLRLWYSTDFSQHPSKGVKSHASQIGYRNFLPRCTDPGQKHPVFDDLSATYNELNESLLDKPLEGHVITVETVGLHLNRQNLDLANVQADQSCWEDSPKFHILYFTRIFYLFECPAYEQIGAADFLPDYEGQQSEKSATPKYSHFASVVDKVNKWLGKVKDIRIANLQTLETLFPGVDKTDQINTSANFIPKADTAPLVKFLRVIYVRPKFGLPPGGLHVPRVITYRAFVPSVTQQETRASGVEFEAATSHYDRVKAWLRHVDKRILGCEVVWHPLPLINKKKDRGEATLIKGTWFFPADTAGVSKETMQRVPAVQMLRVYFEGRYEEPSQQSLPAPPGGVHQKQGCIIL